MACKTKLQISMPHQDEKLIRETYCLLASFQAAKCERRSGSGPKWEIKRFESCESK